MKSFFFYFLLVTIPLMGDWNQSFDEESRILAQEMPLFQNQDYQKQYSFFLQKRQKLLLDQNLQKKIGTSSLSKKFFLIDKQKNLIIKKRRENHIHDFFAWEMSYLLNGSQFLTPSFPIEIRDQRIIAQKIEPFEVGIGKREAHSAQAIKKISLETYWKSHLVAYLLGIADLAGRNIGISPEGIVRFFDTEISFCYFNTPTKTTLAFTTGYILQSFDWPHYRKPLDKKTAEQLQNFVQSLAHVEEDVRIYKKYRSLSFPDEPFYFRLQKVRNFQIKEGMTFRDFFGSTAPKMSQGMDLLNQIVEKILGRKVDHGSALFFTCRWIAKAKVAQQEKATLQQWVNQYIEDAQNHSEAPSAL